MNALKLDFSKQAGDIYNAGSTDYCTHGQRTSRMDIVDAGQCGEITSRIEVSPFGEHRFICGKHDSK